MVKTDFFELIFWIFLIIGTYAFLIIIFDDKFNPETETCDAVCPDYGDKIIIKDDDYEKYCYREIKCSDIYMPDRMDYGLVFDKCYDKVIDDETCFKWHKDTFCDTCVKEGWTGNNSVYIDGEWCGEQCSCIEYGNTWSELKKKNHSTKIYEIEYNSSEYSKGVDIYLPFNTKGIDNRTISTDKNNWTIESFYMNGILEYRDREQICIRAIENKGDEK